MQQILQSVLLDSSNLLVL